MRFLLKKRLLFLLLSSAIFHLGALEEHWKPVTHVWDYAIAFESDTPPKVMPLEWDPEIYATVQPGDIVWVYQAWLDCFQEEVLPTITHPFILVTNLSDETFPTYFRSLFDTESFINDPRILHIFAQNCDLVHPKITSIPIGLDLHSMAYEWRRSRGEFSSPQEQHQVLINVLSMAPPTSKRIPRIFVDFQHHDTLQQGINNLRAIFGETRTSLFHKLKQSGLIDYSSSRLERIKLWETKTKYAFSISVPGNGWDAHRTWEDLILGCILIVKSSPLDVLYEGLPVVIIQNWNEITEQNLLQWQKEFGDAFTNPKYREKLTHLYWMNQIKAKQITFRQGSYL